MNDPRKILEQELIKIGISSRDAAIIALDTGSSQVFVNREYLNDFPYLKSMIKMALGLVGKFYSRELFEKF